MNFINELKRRNVFRVAGVYAVVAWLLMQLSTQLEGSLNLPSWFDTFVTVIVLIGFPIALVIAWAFQMTPQGVKLTQALPDREDDGEQNSHKRGFVIFGSLVALIVLAVAGTIKWQSGILQTKLGQTKTPMAISESPANTEPVKKASSQTIPSIAVLPFDDFSQDKDQAYFANGISEELLNVLARIDGLRVASRTSAFSFQGSGSNTGHIAQALNVEHILEGSVRKSGATLRITAQLIDASSDQHMWSDTYDRPLTAENLFEIQDDIAEAIVNELKGQLSITKEAAPRTASLEAYQLYLRARENMAKRLPATLRAAIEGFEQVIELDPKFAPAYAGLADAHLLMPAYAETDETIATSTARNYIDEALKLAPRSAETLTAAAFLAFNESKFQESVQLATQAIEANSNYASAYLRLSSSYNALVESEKALNAIKKAAELDPLAPVILANLGNLQEQFRDTEGARNTYEKSIRFNPFSQFGYSGLANLKLAKGDYAQAHFLLKDAQALNPTSTTIKNLLSSLYSNVGLFDLALALKTEPVIKAMVLLSSGDVEGARAMAPKNSDFPHEIYFFLGQTDKAYSVFRKFLTDNDIVSKPAEPNTLGLLLISAALFKEKSDPDAQIIIDKLTEYFKNKQPSNFSEKRELSLAGYLALIKGTPEKAFPWFERELDLGFPGAGIKNLVFPGLKELRNYPKWNNIEKRYEENAAKHRALIEAQLLTPQANWIKG